MNDLTATCSDLGQHDKALTLISAIVADAKKLRAKSGRNSGNTRNGTTRNTGRHLCCTECETSQVPVAMALLDHPLVAALAASGAHPDTSPLIFHGRVAAIGQRRRSR